MMSAESNMSDDEGMPDDVENGIGAEDGPAVTINSTINGESPNNSSASSKCISTTDNAVAENGNATDLSSNGIPPTDIHGDEVVENEINGHAVDLSLPPSSSSGLPTNEAPGQPPSPKEEGTTTIEDNATSNSTIDPAFQQHAMVALESLESMRRLNLEVEFSNATWSFPVNHDKCTFCQREQLHKFLSNPPKPSVATGGGHVAIGEGSINIGKVKLDGSRIRRFRSNVGGFFSKSASNVSRSLATEASQSCPPSLASQSNKSLSSMESGEETASNNGSIANNNRAARRNILKKKIHPCLTCGHPTCSTHSTSTFSKNHIPICQPCAYLFELDFLVDVIASTASNTKECEQKVNDMVDCYDRAKLLLTYTAQYADEIASALETHTVRSNKIGAGSSATGIVSGITGVVGCGALLFPPVAAVGVPLLIASLVFGGGATAVQSGDAAVKYFSEPNKLAEKMVALHGMVLSLLRITEVLSYGLLKSQCGVNYSVEGFIEGEDGEDDEGTQREALKKEINELLEKHGVTTTKVGVGALQSAVATGIVATEVAAASTRIVATEAMAAGAVAGTEAAISTSTVASGASVVGRNSRFFGRVGTTAASTARFVPIAGGLLSAACIYVEGKELKKTLSRIDEGNPCAKAEQVRSIRDELDMLPDSSLIAAECRRVFDLAQKEKMKKAALVEIKKVGDVELNDVSQGDISDIIDCMETAAKVDGMEESTPGA